MSERDSGPDLARVAFVQSVMERIGARVAADYWTRQRAKGCDDERASWATERAALVAAGNGLAAFLASDEWMDPTTDDECSNVLNTWYVALAADSQTSNEGTEAPPLADRAALVAAGYDLWDWVEAVAEDNYWRGEDEELVGRALDQWRALATDPGDARMALSDSKDCGSHHELSAAPALRG